MGFQREKDLEGDQQNTRSREGKRQTVAISIDPRLSIRSTSFYRSVFRTAALSSPMPVQITDPPIGRSMIRFAFALRSILT